GGLKLRAALDAFKIDPESLTILDVGASTGGFTDCLIQAGARQVIALDVGHGQLDWNLRNHARVRVVERFNARYLTPGTLREAIGAADPLPPLDLAVADLSFISLGLILPALATLSPLPRLVCLVKPQFEAGRREVGRGGLVRDPAIHARVLEQFSLMAMKTGWRPRDLIPSPLRGARGNREFLADLDRWPSGGPLELPPRIVSAIRSAVRESPA
ncbi:MAG: TlyA family RNA methyltransferase, partial [Acidobacteriota bacterium]